MLHDINTLVKLIGILQEELSHTLFKPDHEHILSIALATYKKEYDTITGTKK